LEKFSTSYTCPFIGFALNLHGFSCLKSHISIRPVANGKSLYYAIYCQSITRINGPASKKNAGSMVQHQKKESGRATETQQTFWHQELKETFRESARGNNSSLWIAEGFSTEPTVKPTEANLSDICYMQ